MAPYQETDDPFAPPVIRPQEIPSTPPLRPDGPLTFAHRVTFDNHRFTTIYSKLLNPWPALLTAGYASLCLPIVARFPYGFPTTLQLSGITALYLAGGQIMASGDDGCGSLLNSVAALTHLAFFGPRAIRCQRRIPLILAGTALTNFAIYAPGAIRNVIDVSAGKKPFLALKNSKAAA